MFHTVEVIFLAARRVLLCIVFQRVMVWVRGHDKLPDDDPDFDD